MSALNPTPPRIALMGAIDCGEIAVERDGHGKLEIWWSGRFTNDGRLRNRFHELVEAGLVKRIPPLAMERRTAALTAEGVKWRAEHDLKQSDSEPQDEVPW